MLPTFLTTQYPLDKQLFLIPRFAYGLLGFYPETERTCRVRLVSFLNFFILAYGIYAEIYYGIHYLRVDVPTALDVLCPAATSCLSFFMLFYVWWYRNEFKYLIERVRELTTEQDSGAKLQVKKRYFMLTTRLTALIMLLGLSCCCMYSLRPIVTNTILYLNGEDIIYVTPFKMIFPKPLLSMPLYPVTYLLVYWHGCITALAFVGTIGQFLGFCFYFATLLKALQEDLRNILLANAGHSEQAVHLALRDIVRRHNEIAELIGMFSVVNLEITLYKFITSSIIIAISTVVVLLASGLNILLYVAFTFGALAEIFLYCLGGNAVIESSEELATVAYSSEWYMHSVRVQRSVLLIMIRSQRRMVVKLPFFAPSLPTLTAILRFAGSVLALVKSII